MSNEQLPLSVIRKRAQMDEPSERRDLDHACHCGEVAYYIGIKYHKVTFATVIDVSEDGFILGDRTAPAPYGYWICRNGHVETDGY